MQKAIVIGASSGIGRELAMILSQKAEEKLSEFLDYTVV